MSHHGEKRVRSLTEIALADQPAMLLLAVIAPMLILILTTVLGTGMVRDLPIGVCDQENSALSRKIVRALEGSPALKIVSVVVSPEESNRLLINGSIYGFVTIPSDFSQFVKEGKPARIEARLNTQSYLSAGYIRREIQNAGSYFSAGVTVTRLTKQGISSHQSLAVAAPVTADVSLIGNHSGNYRWYLIPAMVLVQIGGILTIAAMLFTSGLVEKRLHHHPHGPEHATTSTEFFARFRVLIAFAFLHLLLILGVAFPLTGITTPDETVTAVGPVSLFFIASILMGTGIGFLFPRRINAASAGLIISMPAFIYSGYSFPQVAMPEVVQLISQIMPFTHFMPIWNLSVRLNYDSPSLIHSWVNLALITLGGTVLTVFGIIRNDRRGKV